MKKVLIIFLSFFLALGYVNATDEVFDIKCNYNLKNVNNMDFGKMEVIIYDYDESSSNYTYEVRYENNSGQMVKYNSLSVYDYKNSSLNGTRGLGFFCKRSSCMQGIDAAEMKEFYDYYKAQGKCKPVYFSSALDNTRVQTWIFNQDDKVLLSASSIQFKGLDDSSWISEEEFKRRNQNPDNPGDDRKELVCSYKMFFDLTSSVSTVIFKKTIVNGTTYYYVTINDNETPITSFDSTVHIAAGNYTSAYVRIEPSDLKSIFGRDTCIEATKIYHYLDSATSDLGIHYITLDGKKAAANGTGGRVGDGTGAKPSVEIAKRASGEGASNPPADDADDGDIEIPDGNISTCVELVGSNLAAIIKVSITILQIVAAIIAVVKGMMVLIPPIIAKDADALKKAGGTLTKMAIILVIIFLFKPLLKFIGNVLDFDVSCLL